MEYRVDFMKRVSRTVEADSEDAAIEKTVELLNRPNADGSTWEAEECENVTPIE